jgi:Domain of unknown function (DUF397)
MSPNPPGHSSELSFVVSSFCHQGGCVGVAELPGGGRAVANATLSGSPILQFSEAEWLAFVAGVKNGDFD